MAFHLIDHGNNLHLLNKCIIVMLIKIGYTTGLQYAFGIHIFHGMIHFNGFFIGFMDQ